MSINRYETFKKMRWLLFLVMLGLSSSGHLQAQDDSRRPNDRAGLNTVYYTSTDSISVDTAGEGQHSPTLAAILSMVVPGAGQIYNRKYWKVPVIYAGFATGLYFNRMTNAEYVKYKDEYVKFKTTYKRINKQLPTDTTFIINEYPYNIASLKEQRDRLRRLRDITIISLSVWYFMNVIDASVDAYFFDYDISDDLSMRVYPSGFFLRRDAYYASLHVGITF